MMALIRLLATTLAAVPLFAQPDFVPKFDSASVKPVVGDWVFEYKMTPGSLTWRGAYIGWMIHFAYGLQQPFQVEGPDWTKEGPKVLRFDIYARTDHPSSETEMRLMMRALLAERWKLVTHRETKEVPAFILTVGKGPLKLRKSESSAIRGQKIRDNEFDFTATAMPELAGRISDFVPQLIVDETGIEGRFDFTVAFMKYTTNVGTGSDQWDYATGFARALQDIGLKLEPKRRSAEIVVIDHAEKVPTGN